MILEYAVGNIAVAIGWSGYFSNLLSFFGLHLPAWLSIDPMTASNALAVGAAANAELFQLAQKAFDTAPNFGFPLVINLPAVLIVLLVTSLLVYGVRESARVTTGLVILKIGLIALFIIVGVQFVDFETQWKVFAPNGWNGIMTGTALIFFAHIGFDAVSTTAEEAKNPQRDLPIGMIASLIICTVLYILVATVLTGMVPLGVLANEKPVAAALDFVGAKTTATIISLGAVLSITSVLVVMQYGQTRIFYSMSRDGLLPRWLSKIHPKFGTPALSTIFTGSMVAIPAGLIDINVAAELTNIGTLFAFVLVAGGIMVLRAKEPDRERKFRVPFAWFFCPACIAICVYLMCSLTKDTWERFVLWMIIGFVFYFAYGFRHSVVNRKLRTAGRDNVTR